MPGTVRIVADGAWIAPSRTARIGPTGAPDAPAVRARRRLQLEGESVAVIDTVLRSRAAPGTFASFSLRALALAGLALPLAAQDAQPLRHVRAPANGARICAG